METTQLTPVTQSQSAPDISFSEKHLNLIRRTICQGATDEELAMFIQQCKRYGLDPFTGQIHAVMRWDSRQKREVLNVQVGIDGFRVIADRTGKWRGVRGPFWCGPDGEWREIWLEDEPPTAAKVGVLRADFDEPRWGIARWSDYVETKKNGDPVFMWGKMGAHMLGKCAESLALRSAFPNDLSGLYTDAEMSQAGGEPQRLEADSDIDEDTGDTEVADLAEWQGEMIPAKQKERLNEMDARLEELPADAVPRKADELQDWAKKQGNEAFTRRVTDLCEGHIAAAMAEERAKPDGA